MIQSCFCFIRSQSFAIPLIALLFISLGLATSSRHVGADDSTASTEVATFAGGCFWCMEPPFDKMPGVISTTPGYTGGRVKNPTYDQVKTGKTGHIESIQIEFDPSKVSYEQLLTLFWHNVDPLNGKGQFCDKGNQYRTAIFYHDEHQQQAAKESKSAIAKKLGRGVKTELIQAKTFYPAEEYHQDYYTKNPKKYKFYRWTCGRDARLDELWKEDARKP